ncbi:MAG: sulfotransferase [Acidobacteria bacterium]|nr:sulfotransferase [Acidobacteriota bacterium]
MSVRVLYIAGLGRSGSTLLTRLLGQVDEICAVGEVHHLWRTGASRAATDELCGCGRSYAECGFWPDRLRAAFAEIGEVPVAGMQTLADRVARIRRLGRLERGGDAAFEAAVATYGEVWSRLYAELAEHTGCDVILDASKDLGPLFFLSRVPGIEVSVVHLVRDPRAVAYSWSQRKLRPEFVDREVYMNRHGAVDVSWRWWYSNLLASRARRLFPDFLRLRYEDFVAEPRGTLERLCSLVGIGNVDLTFLEGASARLGRSNCTVSGNPMRFDAGEVTIRRDDDWRQRMPRASRLLVGALTWPLRRRYGYRGGGA